MGLLVSTPAPDVVDLLIVKDGVDGVTNMCNILVESFKKYLPSLRSQTIRMTDIEEGKSFKTVGRVLFLVDSRTGSGKHRIPLWIDKLAGSKRSNTSKESKRFVTLYLGKKESGGSNSFVSTDIEVTDVLRHFQWLPEVYSKLVPVKRKMIKRVQTRISVNMLSWRKGSFAKITKHELTKHTFLDVANFFETASEIKGCDIEALQVVLVEASNDKTVPRVPIDEVYDRVLVQERVPRTVFVFTNLRIKMHQLQTASLENVFIFYPPKFSESIIPAMLSLRIISLPGGINTCPTLSLSCLAGMRVSIPYFNYREVETIKVHVNWTQLDETCSSHDIILERQIRGDNRSTGRNGMTLSIPNEAYMYSDWETVTTTICRMITYPDEIPRTLILRGDWVRYRMGNGDSSDCIYLVTSPWQLVY